MQKIIIILFVVFSISAIGGKAELAAQNLDSLLAAWHNKSLSDSTRAVAYKDYVIKGFLFSQPDSAFFLAKDLALFGQAKHYPKAQAYAFNIQGISCYLRGDYPRALDHYTRGLKIQEQMGDQKGIAASLGNIGLIHYNQGNYAKALDYYTKSLKIFEAMGDKKGIASSLSNIGLIYKSKMDYAKALDYYANSLTSGSRLMINSVLQTPFIISGRFISIKAIMPKH